MKTLRAEVGEWTGALIASAVVLIGIVWFQGGFNSIGAREVFLWLVMATVARYVR